MYVLVVNIGATTCTPASYLAVIWLTFIRCISFAAALLCSTIVIGSEGADLSTTAAR